MSGVQQPFLIQPELPPLPVGHEPRGVVYTKRWVVDLLLDLAGYTPRRNLAETVAIEPAAGDGAFLGPMVERLAESCQIFGNPISTSQNSLLAYEVDEASAESARLLAANVLMERGILRSTAEALARSWVRTADYLLEAPDVAADFVIGNPPYVRLEEIPEERAWLYRRRYSTMCGRADLYVAFFEAGLRQLKKGGACAFICADRWMRNQYGAELRGLITSGFSVDILMEMHKANAFHDEVDAYPAITVIRRQMQGAAVVAVASPATEEVPSETLALKLLGEPDGAKHVAPFDFKVARVNAWFKGSDPWPCQSPDQLALLRRLEEQFAPLEAYARVGIGVATGNDSVFVTKDRSLVEPSRLLKLAMAKDLSSGRLQWSGHYLVDPWNREGLVSLDEYPRLSAYLIDHKASLKSRHTALKNARAWYKTIDRVTHALAAKRKLYIADIKSTLDPVLDVGETYPHHNLYFVESDRWDLKVLGGLLLSDVAQFFVESYGVRMRGGYFRFQAQYLRRIRVPAPDAISREQETDLREAFQSRDRQRATKAAFEIYGIAPNEMERALGR